MSKLPQWRVILNHLKIFREITPADAIAGYNITRLAAIIHRLINEGYPIRNVNPHGQPAKYILDYAA
ncbi:helix-turn-helix domain-containing protein [Halodesulfovibrio sp.]|jgi:hypothetical protein|uniref:helix-turn-helix domain-containing protein n=1 Tax=Halodesulfovibrio sp. TaxID=1912772 RepID=UPI0025D24D23|nr:helix-turn-helix domain-containing protein [Halodesulfovibrio sp.]MCT4535789.1 helix-turn-helix domain-containing protein [Halodesulfovibrio sp.]